jgi:hypothetical protein
VNDPEQILVTLPAPSPILVSFQPAPQVTVQVAISPVEEVTLPAPAPIALSFQPVPQLIAQVALSAAGLKGDKGDKGDTGDRGNLFLGGYPTLINLPAIDGDGVRIGDYALVNDTSTMYQVR